MVSIIMATYNGAVYIEKQITSILNQTYSDFELLIIDDGSTDETYDIVRTFEKQDKRIKIFKNKENLGPNATFFNGLSLANNPLIAFTDQDDIWFEEKLERQLAAMADYSLSHIPVACFHNAILIDQDDNVLQDSYWEYRNIDPENQTFQKSLTRNIITGCTLLINKAMVEQLRDNLKENYDHITYHDHFIALLAYGFGKVLPIKEPLMYYRSHTGTVTGKIERKTWQKVSNVIKLLSQKKYVQKNIEQANKLLSLYGADLPSENKTVINRFSSIQSNPFKQILWQLKNK